MDFERKQEIPPSLYFREPPSDNIVSDLVEELLTQEEVMLFEEFSEMFMEELEEKGTADVDIFETVFEKLPHTRRAVDKYILFCHKLSGRDM